MANGSVTDTGLSEFRRAIDRLPKTVTAKLRAAAWQSSRRIMERSKQILRSKTHGTGKTADSIHVIEEAAEKRFIVRPETDPPNLGLWLERGTRYMTARPFLRPAADEEDPRYQRDMVSAAEDAVSGLEK